MLQHFPILGFLLLIHNFPVADVVGSSVWRWIFVRLVSQGTVQNWRCNSTWAILLDPHKVTVYGTLKSHLHRTTLYSCHHCRSLLEPKTRTTTMNPINRLQYGNNSNFLTSVLKAEIAEMLQWTLIQTKETPSKEKIQPGAKNARTDIQYQG